MHQKDIEKAVDRFRSSLKTMDITKLENLTIREITLAASNPTPINPGVERASIVSVIVLIIFGDSPVGGGGEG